MATIVVLEHELQRYVELPYMVRLFAERWRERGHRVHVHWGLGDPPPGDVAVLHVDLTVVPPAYAALAARYPRVVNGRVLDVSKSRFSEQLVRPQTIWHGPVIVKTEANFGGKPEQLFRSVAAQRGMGHEIPPGPLAEGYPIFESMRAVPEAVWRTPGLVVERFLPERDAQGRYGLRVWTFLGNQDRCVRWLAAEPIVKASNRLAREAAEVPAELRAWREKLGFDFGKFDFVDHEGRWVLLDVNRTPSFPSDRPGPAREAVRALGDGIDAFLR
jgi:hypothetical protein